MRALVIGGASCVFKDIEHALALFNPDIVVAANDIGTRYERVDHLCTMHPMKMQDWLKARRANGFSKPEIWTAVHKNKTTKLPFRQVDSVGGSSGLLCVRVCRALEATRIVLAGVPMTAQLGHFHVTGNWIEAEVYRRTWEKDRPHLLKDTRSMSGWTMELLGAPTSDWLKE